tara:strand:+ start:7541 stop:10108 length:2568 start_codon:yes stop_codon:yes gene_type:complete
MKKMMKRKKAMTTIRAYFLMINMIVAVVAFSWGVGLVSGEVKDRLTEARQARAQKVIDAYNTQQSIPPLSAPLPVDTNSLKLERDSLYVPPLDTTPLTDSFLDFSGLVADLQGLENDIPGLETDFEDIDTFLRNLDTQTTIAGQASEISKLNAATESLNEKLGEQAKTNKDLQTQLDTFNKEKEVLEKTIEKAAADALKNIKPGKHDLGGDIGIVDVSLNNGIPGYVNKKGDWTKLTPEQISKIKSSGSSSCKGLLCKINLDDKLGGIFKGDLMATVTKIGGAFMLGYGLGGVLFGDNGGEAMGAAFAAGTFVADTLGAGGFWGVVAGAALFYFMYRDRGIIKVEFTCLPWEAPIGGADCQKCNNYEECSEYRCKSLGQACELKNEAGEKLCAWVNPNDVNSPKIQMLKVNKGHIYIPDTNIRPPAVGVEIKQESGGPCIEAFTPLEFTIESTNEPAQCKIDYNLTREFDRMSYYMGGTNAFSYNHTETLSLPGPENINAIAPELKNDGTYTLYVRCQDANGNFNQDPYSVRFCVKKGPDTTPPRIDDTSVPSNSGIRFNQSTLDLDVYINEPAECKWSREDKDYSLMENDMVCDLNIDDMRKINNNWLYTCQTTLTGIKNRQDNEYYFRCNDNPHSADGDRNDNKQSYLYNIIGTQPLTLLELKPENGDVIKGSTDTIPVMLEAETDNGYNDGDAVCSYTESNIVPDSDDYIDFRNTGTNTHSQSQHLTSGTYNYYIRCIDVSGNAVYENITFEVESDDNAPAVIRVYKDSGQLKIITSEEAECSYSHTDCNFDIVDGISMSSVDNEVHTSEWSITKYYYIRCNDRYDNQPDPNTCSIELRPYKFADKSNVIEL